MSVDLKFVVQGLNFYYGEFQALDHITLDIEKNSVTALIGPSGCGKSTFLGTLNRLNDMYEGTHIEGTVLYDGHDIYRNYEIIELRKRIGMVFQRPNPFPMSIYENVVYGPRIHGIKNKKVLRETALHALQEVGLLDEVKDKLNMCALDLSGGQQQRLCIARAIAYGPDVILLDEPTSALDPISSKKIEELMGTLADHYTIIVVTHNLEQAARISNTIAFFYRGRLIESGPTRKLFLNPSEKLLDDYMKGNFG